MAETRGWAIRSTPPTPTTSLLVAHRSPSCHLPRDQPAIPDEEERWAFGVLAITGTLRDIRILGEKRGAASSEKSPCQRGEEWRDISESEAFYPGRTGTYENR